MGQPSLARAALSCNCGSVKACTKVTAFLCALLLGWYHQQRGAGVAWQRDTHTHIPLSIFSLANLVRLLCQPDQSVFFRRSHSSTTWQVAAAASFLSVPPHPPASGAHQTPCCCQRNQAEDNDSCCRRKKTHAEDIHNSSYLLLALQDTRKACPGGNSYLRVDYARAYVDAANKAQTLCIFELASPTIKAN
eukprot:1146814-Pelagomonas_calceolata.AAC.4